MRKKIFILWFEKSVGHDTTSVEVERYDKFSSAMEALEGIAAAFKRKVFFIAGTEYGGAPAIWAKQVHTGGGNFYITEDEE